MDYVETDGYAFMRDGIVYDFRDELLFWNECGTHARATKWVKGPGPAVAGGGCGRAGSRFSLSGLRIVFIARPLSLTADFYSVSLHKSAYDILCAPARKIVRNFSRPGPDQGGTRNFFNFHTGPRLTRLTVHPLRLPRDRVVRSRESAVYPSAHFFFSLPTHFFFRGARERIYGTTIKALRSRNSRREIDIVQRARTLHDNIYKLIFCVSFLIKYSCIRYGYKTQSAGFLISVLQRLFRAIILRNTVTLFLIRSPWASGFEVAIQSEIWLVEFLARTASYEIFRGGSHLVTAVHGYRENNPSPLPLMRNLIPVGHGDTKPLIRSSYQGTLLRWRTGRRNYVRVHAVIS